MTEKRQEPDSKSAKASTSEVDNESVTGCGYVYVLGSEGAGGRRTYVGWTTDITRRLEAHNSGKGARSTRGRQWRLIYAERYPTRKEAQSREWFLKKDRALRASLLKLLTVT